LPAGVATTWLVVSIVEMPRSCSYPSPATVEAAAPSQAWPSILARSFSCSFASLNSITSVTMDGPPRPPAHVSPLGTYTVCQFLDKPVFKGALELPRMQHDISLAPLATGTSVSQSAFTSLLAAEACQLEAPANLKGVTISPLRGRQHQERHERHIYSRLLLGQKRLGIW